MTTMINCDLKTFKDMISRYPKHSEGQALQAACKGLFNSVESGRQIQPSTWMMAVRANQRGKLVLSRLVRRSNRRTPLTAEETKLGLEKQQALLSELMAKCPEFFAGVLVLPTPKPVPVEEQAAVTA